MAQWSKSRVSAAETWSKAVQGRMRTPCAKGRGQNLWHLLISIAMKVIMAWSNFQMAPGVPDE